MVCKSPCQRYIRNVEFLAAMGSYVSCCVWIIGGRFTRDAWVRFSLYEIIQSRKISRTSFSLANEMGVEHLAQLHYRLPSILNPILPWHARYSSTHLKEG